MRLTGTRYTTTAKLVDELEGDEEIILAMPAGTTDEAFRKLVHQNQYHLDLDHRYRPERFGMEEMAVAQLFTVNLTDAPRFDGALATLPLTAHMPTPYGVGGSVFLAPSATIPLKFEAAVMAFAEVEVVHRSWVPGL